MKRDLVMEALCRQIGREIGKELSDTTTGPPMGFLLLMFDFAPKPGDTRPDAGKFCTHVTNGRREDIIKLLREHADKLEAGTDNELGYRPPGRS